jgi:hypothetical protein
MHASKKKNNKEEDKTIIHHSPPSPSSGDFWGNKKAPAPRPILLRYGMAGSLGVRAIYLDRM